MSKYDRDYNFVGPYAPVVPAVVPKAGYRVERVDNPAEYFARHAAQLSEIGADAFGQPVEDFAPQVEERFNKAEFGHAMIHRDGRGNDELVGFGLFDMLRGRHWQLAFD